MAKDDIVDAETKPASDGFMNWLVIFTTLALVAGWFLINSAKDKSFGGG